MQTLKNKLATLGFIGLIALALLPAGLSVCGPAVSKIAHHGKRLHQVARSNVPAFKATQQHARAIVSDVLLEENREARNAPHAAAAARSLEKPHMDDLQVAWTARVLVTSKLSSNILPSVLNL
jgi:hypothetical protein